MSTLSSTEKGRTRMRRGFTLIELLVVITIIGVLMSMIMPAIQVVQDAVRETQCLNNVKQLSVACSSYNATIRHYPSGGWAHGWAGDKDFGTGEQQPGSWLFSILPYLDGKSLYQMGAGGNKSEGRDRASTAVPAFSCPARGSNQLLFQDIQYQNISKPVAVGRTDYAGCGGSSAVDTTWDGAGADKLTREEWGKKPGTDGNGMILRRNVVRTIEDGADKTYICGERYLDRQYYLSPNPKTIGQGWDCGYDRVNIRWCVPSVKLQNDVAGLASPTAFGGPHLGGFNMGFADGTCKKIRSTIDGAVHKDLSTRNGHELIDHTNF